MLMVMVADNSAELAADECNHDKEFDLLLCMERQDMLEPLEPLIMMLPPLLRSLSKLSLPLPMVLESLAKQILVAAGLEETTKTQLDSWGLLKTLSVFGILKVDISLVSCISERSTTTGLVVVVVVVDTSSSWTTSSNTVSLTLNSLTKWLSQSKVSKELVSKQLVLDILLKAETEWLLTDSHTKFFTSWVRLLEKISTAVALRVLKTVFGIWTGIKTVTNSELVLLLLLLVEKDIALIKK